METSVSTLERLAGAPTDADWRRLDELYGPLLLGWVARVGVPASDVDGQVLPSIGQKAAPHSQARHGSTSRPS
jgi:hypothetical protein